MKKIIGIALIALVVGIGIGFSLGGSSGSSSSKIAGFKPPTEAEAKEVYWYYRVYRDFLDESTYTFEKVDGQYDENTLTYTMFIKAGGIATKITLNHATNLPIEAGDRYSVEESVPFKKTENGWRFDHREAEDGRTSTTIPR